MGVLVNQALTILQFRRQTGPYLETAGGPPSFDLRRVIRPELLVQILPAITETSKTGVASQGPYGLFRDWRRTQTQSSVTALRARDSNGCPVLQGCRDHQPRGTCAQ
jgi:hypothetical protein